MMNVLSTIGFDVLECLSQLYDYYLFSVSYSSRLWLCCAPCTSSDLLVKVGVDFAALFGNALCISVCQFIPYMF